MLHRSQASISSALITAKYAAPVVGAADLTASVDVLREKVARVHAGDLSDAEAMLVAHMGTLNAMFCDLARRAALNMGEYPDVADRYLRQALKTQGQCRATIETLGVPQESAGRVCAASEHRERAAAGE